MIDHPRYRVVGDVGRGAQGRVVRVIDRERPEAALVAKIMGGPAGSAATLEGELALLARVRVPGLVRAHDLARDANGVLFLVEDLVVGDAPARWLHRGSDGSATTARFVALAADLAETLAALEDAGLVHGDVKPDNLRVPARSRAMLFDLGAAAGSVFTPAFAAPELRAGARASFASDVYALGATLHACAADRDGPDDAPIRDHAPWLAPSAAEIVLRMRAPHPADRPRARDVLAALGRTGSVFFESASRGTHVREHEVELLLKSRAPVTYVIGPSGAGKSHLAREVLTRALLRGTNARLVRFPEAPEVTGRLVELLRGAREPSEALLVLDDLDAAPTELVEALDAYRCRVHAPGGSSILATARACPIGAEAITLGPLAPSALSALANELGADAAAARESGGLPGWLVASLGRVPLTKDAALARVRTLPKAAQALLSLVATMGGTIAARHASDDAAALFGAGLLVRERELVRLASPHLAGDLGDALSDFATSDRAAVIALDDRSVPAASILAVAAASSPPERRVELLVEGAARARAEQARSLEIDALLALVASPDERTAARLERLERLTRDGGTSRSHPQVLGWLEEAAVRDPSARPLALRRRAEERARSGDLSSARDHAERACEAATGRVDEAYALATLGSVALFGADWAAADGAFARARAILDRAMGSSRSSVTFDAEEIARLDHNIGVVALYRGRIEQAEDAFTRSLTIKRVLGDRAGVRACLLNLGITLAKRARYDEAERALVEATALATALGQAAGRAWCLAARADVAVRKGRVADAEGLVAEAEAIGDAVPPAVRADLVLLRAQIALVEGRAKDARAAIASLDPETRTGDALVDARALVLESRALLASLPADRRGAARAAIAAIRRARAGGLAEIEPEAITALHRARRNDDPSKSPSKNPSTKEHDMTDAREWSLLRAIATGADAERTLHDVLSFVLGEARAERVFVVTDAQAWGVDLDGLPISHASDRVDAILVANGRRAKAPVYLREVAVGGGVGARLAIAGARVVVVVEHRFTRGAFDHVGEAVASRWATLGDLAVTALGGEAARREPSPNRSEPRPAEGDPNLLSTALPRREPLRDYPDILGRSPVLRRALAQLDAAIDTDLPVLVHGETGVGKELFARALHDHGARVSAPFVAINCAAIADALFEAELFGHAKGAFTGAERARPGLLARAEGGTLFLDEIGELPVARQATLLRALESRRYRPVGNDEERAFDVRIVAATNRDLDAAVADGSFRRDLLYRLRVLEIAVPPLRERTDDVELLARHFLARAGSRAALMPSAIRALEAYGFPGNVRELAHLVQRLAASRADKIEASHLPRQVRAGAAEPSPRATPANERTEVEEALTRTAGNISRAAILLGLTRHGLKKRMLRLGVRAKEREAGG